MQSIRDGNPNASPGRAGSAAGKVPAASNFIAFTMMYGQVVAFSGRRSGISIDCEKIIVLLRRLRSSPRLAK
jgi:hypothetical protein